MKPYTLDCTMCARPSRTKVCRECADYSARLAAMTPEQRRTEELSIARYAEESDL